MDGSALDEEEKAYPLAQDVVKGVSANVKWERLDVFDFFDLRQYLDAQRFGVLPVKGSYFRLNTKGLIRLMAHGAFNLRGCSWGP